MKKTSVLLPVFSVVLFAVLCVILKTSPDRLIGAAFCHQIAARSPEYHFPFCYRCSGLFSGIFFGMIFYLRVVRERKVFAKRSLILFAAALALFAADILNTTPLLKIDWYPEKAEFRFLSAFPMGFFLTGIIAPALHYFLPQEYGTDLPGRSFREFLFFICGWGISFFLIFSGIRILLETARIMICLSSVSFLVLLYCILLHCVSALRHIRCGLRSAVQGAVFAAFMQICLFGTLHILLLPFEELLQ